MTPSNTMEAVKEMYAEGRLTADAVAAALDPPLADTAEKCQQFFQGLAAQARQPGTGDHYRKFVETLLLRAQEANLFLPPSNP